MYILFNEGFLEKYNEISEKVNNIIIKKVNSELIYNQKYLKAKKNI